jgi:formylglycine-generating enzyme required for sulfatase activity
MSPGARSVGLLVALGAAASFGGCQHDWDKLLPSDEPVDAAAGGSGGTAGTGATAGSGGTSSGGSAGQGTGGTGTGGTTGGTGGTTGGTEGPSCNGLAATCGPNGNASCCASTVVTGGTFYRSYDAVTYTDKSNPATVSDFRMDTYEITVGRFRKFVAAYPGSKPVAGAGKNPNNPSDPGWNAAWNTAMPADQASLTAALKCNATWQTWTDSAGANENRPINCITWYEAFAFCIWDGGRLPTEAEWNYAAAGGSEQRAYPWSVPSTSTTIDCTYANYSGCGAGTKNVGATSTKGDGKWGQSDLAGNVWEWVLDWYGSYPNPCNNCANISSAPERVVRGGGFNNLASPLLASNRNSFNPTNRFNYIGSRCVRTP